MDPKLFDYTQPNKYIYKKAQSKIRTREREYTRCGDVFKYRGMAKNHNISSFGSNSPKLLSSALVYKETRHSLRKTSRRIYETFSLMIVSKGHIYKRPKELPKKDSTYTFPRGMTVERKYDHGGV